MPSTAWAVAAVCLSSPISALAENTWKFVDDDGVLHMGNVSNQPGGAVSAEDSDDSLIEVAVTPARRKVRWINRTWTLRYPAWSPTAASTPAQTPQLGHLERGSDRLPLGFNNVKLILDAAAQAHAVDPALVYSVAAAESAFNADAVSHKGALGLMQIMPATAARYGVTGFSQSTGRHNVLEPQANARVGSRYLADLLRLFGGDTALAIAAYNAGEGTVAKYGNKIPPYPETQKYVERVMGYYKSFKR